MDEKIKGIEKMKNKFLKIIIFTILFILAIGLKNTVLANSINSINMDIFVDNDGNAEVTEVWTCSTNIGTEAYHPYYNLGNSVITNLRVYDKEKTYTNIGLWNTKATKSEKAYKCGINIKNNCVELCWGISSYGSNVYTVKYNISNFVSELTDSQIMYWTLIPHNFSNPISSVKIKIHSNTYFEDTIEVWGYGNNRGLCYVKDGAIYMQTERTLLKEEYMTFLAKFPIKTFNTTNYLSHDFYYYYNMAQDDYNYARNIDLLKNELRYLQFFMFIIGICLGLGLFLTRRNIKKKKLEKNYGFEFMKDGNGIKQDVAYYRDIPCNGDIFKTYYIAYQYRIIKNKTDILGAIILKWLRNGMIKIEQRDDKLEKKEDIIILGKKIDKKFDNENEKELFNMMHVASKDGVLENKEFENWCKLSYKKILSWFKNILKEQRNNLIESGLIKIERKGLRRNKYIETPELKEEATRIYGLKRFLLEYTLIEDREIIEVEVLEDYLIYAQLLGIARRVSNKFKELYPSLIEKTNYYSYTNLIYINNVTSRGVSRANSARIDAENYKVGGGGFSSGVGGRGSFGGGGGGGGFR